MKLLAIIITFFITVAVLPSCQKDQTIRPYSDIIVQIDGYEDPITFESIDAVWNYNSATGYIIGNGYKNEYVSLALSGITDTGTFDIVTHGGLAYSDGMDFTAPTISDGYIEIAIRTQQQISGNFHVAMHDGHQSKRINGIFRIVAQ